MIVFVRQSTADHRSAICVDFAIEAGIYQSITQFYEDDLMLTRLARCFRAYALIGHTEATLKGRATVPVVTSSQAHAYKCKALSSVTMYSFIPTHKTKRSIVLHL